MDTIEEVEYAEETCWDNEQEDFTQLCRVCANPNEYLIPIYEGEGLEHELSLKISKHLPIKVSETDKLPTQLCYQCASTLIAWHDLVTGCVEADEKLSCLIKAEESAIGVAESKHGQLSQTRSTGPSRKATALRQTVKFEDSDDDPKDPFGDEVENEKILVVEEVTTLEDDVKEEDSMDSRPLTFSNFQIAISHLRNQLLILSNKKSKKKLSVKLPKPNNHKKYTNLGKTLATESTNTKQIKGSCAEHIELSKSSLNYVTCSCAPTVEDLEKQNTVYLNIDEPENKGISDSCTALETSSTNQCDVCCRLFKSKHSLKRHKVVHTRERPFKCVECSKSFRTLSAVSRHVKEVHARVRSHHCDVCNKWFLNRPTLEDHYRTHSDERPFICHQCGMMFKTSSTLYHHSKTHSDYQPHVCAYCSKGFRRKHQLAAHLTTHTKEKSHVCDKCGRAFSRRTELQRHIATHSEVKPYLCLSCGLNFSQNRYLKSHVKSKHGQAVGTIPVDSLAFS